jgi:hypothetical protein
MSAYVVIDQQGNPASYGTVTPASLPAGMTFITISDADYAAVLQGLKRYRAGVIEDTGLATILANQNLVAAALLQGLTDLTAVGTRMTNIANSAALPAGTALTTTQLTTIARQMDTAIRGIATDVGAMSLGLKRLIRWAIGEFSGSS